MNAVPPLRTSPTIKPSAASNRKSLSNVRFSFSAPHVVMLLGLITGCMACAFYLGFYSGQSTGFEHALDRALANAPRVPLTSGEEERVVEDDIAERVYARLGEQNLEIAPEDTVIKEERVVAEPSGSLEERLAAPAGEEAKLAEKEEVAVPAAQEVAALNSGQDKKLGEILEQAEKSAAAPKSPESVSPVIVAKGDTKPAMAIEAAKPAQNEAAIRVGVGSLSANAGAATQSTRTTKPAPPPVENKTTGGSSEYIRSVLPKGWYAQVAAPKKLEDSHAIAAKLKASGFPVMIERANVRGEEYFRVMVGPEGSREMGNRLVQQLKRESAVKSDPFIRMVK